MKRRTVYAASIIVGALFGIGMGTANASPSGEYAARTATHIPSTITYDGNYDRMSATVVCYEGRAGHHTTYRGHTVHTRHYVQYCTDGWVSIQGLRDRWHDVAPRVCAYEDSINCFWDAARTGNHRGHSYYATKHCVFYTERAYAEAQNYCTSWT